MMYTVLIYGFPIILLAFEWGLRTIIEVDSVGFTGPTLAAAGLSFLVSLAKPKVLGEQRDENGKRIILTSGADSEFIGFVWLLILTYLFIWSATCYFSVVNSNDRFLGVQVHFAIGLAAYVFSLLMSFLKEKV